MQEGAAAVIAGLPTWAGRAKLTTWARVVARNAMLRYAQKQGRHRSVSLDEARTRPSSDFADSLCGYLTLLEAMRRTPDGALVLRSALGFEDFGSGSRDRVRRSRCRKKLLDGLSV